MAALCRLPADLGLTALPNPFDVCCENCGHVFAFVGYDDEGRRFAMERSWELVQRAAPHSSGIPRFGAAGHSADPGRRAARHKRRANVGEWEVVWKGPWRFFLNCTHCDRGQLVDIPDVAPADSDVLMSEPTR